MEQHEDNSLHGALIRAIINYTLAEELYNHPRDVQHLIEFRLNQYLKFSTRISDIVEDKKYEFYHFNIAFRNEKKKDSVVYIEVMPKKIKLLDISDTI